MHTEKTASMTARSGELVKQNAIVDAALQDSGVEHPTTNLPFTAIINGRQFSGSSISLVGATISGLAGAELDDAERIATLKFGFGAYTVSVLISARVSRTDMSTGTLRLMFTEPAGDHLPALRYILNSYVAGDIVSLDGLIRARERKQGTEAAVRAPLKSFAQITRTTLRTLATGIATVVLVVMAGKLTASRFLSSDVAQLGYLSQGGETMRALAAGQVVLLNPAAKKGEVIYAIRSATGSTLNVAMPCECKIKLSEHVEGSTVLAGETVVELLKPGASSKVEVAISAAQAKSLLTGDVVTMQFAGGIERTASFVQGRDSLQPIVGSEKLRASFFVEDSLPESARDAPVALRIVNARFNTLSIQFVEAATRWMAQAK